MGDEKWCQWRIVIDSGFDVSEKLKIIERMFVFCRESVIIEVSDSQSFSLT